MAAASTSAALEGVKSCLCGSVQSSISSGGLAGRVRHGGGHKCRVCRTKPRFLLRSQRSLDLGSEGPVTPVEAVTPSSSNTGSPVRALPLRRRARSAERYVQMRINVRAPPRQTSLQSPQSLAPSSSALRGDGESVRRADAMSPPPDYSPPNAGGLLPSSMLAAPASPPPSYEEAELSKSGLSPPSYEESVGQSSWSSTPGRQQQAHTSQQQAASLQLATSSFAAPQHACSCSKCKASSTASARSIRASMAAGAAELRVVLPPEAGTTQTYTQATTTQYLRAPGAGALSASSHDQCSCYKCQSRYSSSYGDPLGDNDVLLTLETQTAMQGILTDGVALCSLV